MIKILLLLSCLSFGAIRSPKELNDLVGAKGEITHFYDLYTRTMPDTGWSVQSYGLEYTGIHSTSGSQFGVFYAPTFYAPAYGADALRLRPHLVGHTPYFSTLALYPPVMDSTGSADHVTLLELMDAVGGKLSNMAVNSRRGHWLIGDTLTASRLVQQGGGEQLHGSLIKMSRQISADTDHILIGYPPGGVVLHDTLPLLSTALGNDYWFIQYQVATDSAWVIIPHVGEKIEGFDSVALRSNLGKARLHLYGQGDRWRVLDHYEEGLFVASLSGVSPAVTDTGKYIIDDLLNLRIRIMPLVGTSNTAGTVMTVTGLTSNFTDATLDTTYTAQAAVVGYDSTQLVSLNCVMALSGTGMNCTKIPKTAFHNTDIKGLPYGAELVGRLRKPAGHR